ncbi:hypothetical protein BDR26DRAFT_922634 [Obelidium mucronatum]|nr:hypothetical protein BDR26DRAFT_922634 [Obelidium mucronatum]
MCYLTQFFGEAMGNVPSEVIAKAIVSLVVTLSVAFLLLVAVESTRPTAKLFCKSFAVVGLLSQTFGISLVIPLLWFTSFLYSNTIGLAKTAKSSGAVIMTSLGSVTILNRIAVGILGFNIVCWIVSVTPPMTSAFKTWMLVFQYYPVYVVAGWAPFSLSAEARRTAETVPESRERSTQAINIFHLFGYILTIQYLKDIVTPIITSNNSRELVFDMVWFLWHRPTEKLAIVPWFLYVESFSLFVTATLFVAEEAAFLCANWAISIISYFVGSLLIGPSASLMLFCAWRENKLSVLIEP